MVWPWAADFIASNGAGNTISQVTERADTMPAKERQWYLDQARAYNDQLAGLSPSMDPSKIASYKKQLAFDGDSMMSWIEIPSINVSLPIYHGASDAVLMAGVGHVKNTSLPVGGSSTHCVLTAHSGMRNLRMFDDIRQLAPGDLVLLHTLGNIYAYQVTGSEVVWPDQVSSLSIEPGKDLLTLVTCTPYGVNDHRLLVHCKRTGYDPGEAADAGALQNRHWGMREWALLIAALAASVIAADVAVRRLRAKQTAAYG